jgi:hypothetical protein
MCGLKYANNEGVNFAVSLTPSNGITAVDTKSSTCIFKMPD